MEHRPLADAVEQAMGDMLHVWDNRVSPWDGKGPRFYSTLCGVRVTDSHTFDQVTWQPQADVCGACARRFQRKNGYPLKGGGRRVG